MASPSASAHKGHVHAAGAELDFATRTVHILKRTAKAFVDDNVTRLGAALAFYTTLAVAPLMVLAVAVAGVFFQESVARQRVLSEIQYVVGDQAAAVLSNLGSPINHPEGRSATVLGIFTLLFGAFGVFHHLQEALNSIWRTKPPELSFWELIRYRLSSLAVVLATGFLLLVSLIVSTVLTWGASQALDRVAMPAIYLELSNTLLSFVAITCLFALLFKLLPDTRIAWRHVWLGALITAGLFTGGKTVMGIYLAHTRLTSAYGAAGSLISLLLWSYYAAQIFFLGAEFTRVTALSNGGRDFSFLSNPAERTRRSHELTKRR
ncbi:MAG: ribonuclease [Lacunisphaera sp.]|nr:ribonuclease [Lacunisphaera sp.]